MAPSALRYMLGEGHINFFNLALFNHAIDNLYRYVFGSAYTLGQF
jgi:hypothetical protein